MTPLSREQRRLLEVIRDEVGLIFDRSPENLRILQAAMGYTTMRRARDGVEYLVRSGYIQAKQAGRTNYRRYTVLAKAEEAA